MTAPERPPPAATPAQTPVGAPPTHSVVADAKAVLYWISLGAAAGGLGGLVIGGVGGRLAMLLLRITSDESVRGLESDDGFLIGRFSAIDTAQLLLVTAILGAIAGIVIVGARPFLPRRYMSAGWGFAGALVGGALIVHRDGVDFTVLSPRWLAVALFVALPGLGAFAIAWAAEQYRRFWWKRRGWTILASIAALPALAIFPLPAGALVLGAAWVGILRLEGARSLPSLPAIRAAALVVFAAVVSLAAFDLVRDARALL